MGVLEEIREYCEEPNTFGALLVTGEWGCGKTHLIKHEFCNSANYRSRFAFILISLFGVDSIDSLHRQIKREYLSLQNPIVSKKTSKAVSGVKQVASIFADMYPGGRVVDSLFSIDPIDYVEVKPEFASKTVVLILDDIERCKTISVTDLLGCINEYCENQGLKVILIANEKGLSKDDSMKYTVLKEKVVARTIKFAADYNQIVGQIIANYKEERTEGYYKFLQGCQPKIVSVISASGNYNLRSLKSGLQDFERIYKVYYDKKVKNKLDGIFLPFLNLVIETKSGVSCEDTEQQPSHNSQRRSDMFNLSLLPSIRKWAQNGAWDENALRGEIDAQIEKEKPLDAKDKLRLYHLLELSEKDINEGFELFISDVYAGNIELNDYINLLGNIAYAREIKYQFPKDFDYTKIQEGVESFLKKDSKNEKLINDYRRILMDESLSSLNDEERKIYQFIVDYRDGDLLILENNRRSYLEALSSCDMNRIVNCEDMRFKCFDSDMANKVAECFEKLQTTYKLDFINYFFRMWRMIIASPSDAWKLSQDGFKYLKELITSQTNAESMSPLDRVRSDLFIQHIDKLISFRQS